MKRLEPGVYDDGEGGLHLVLSELLEAHGVADTAENRATLAKSAQQIFGGSGMTVEVKP